MNLNFLTAVTAILLLSFGSAFASPQLTQQSDSIEIAITESSPQISGVDYHTYNFGRVPVRSLQSVTYRVRNVGNSFLTFRDAYITGADFQAFHSCRRGLRPAETCEFQIRYWPAMEGYDSGTFELSFQENSSIRVQVHGQAVRY